MRTGPTDLATRVRATVDRQLRVLNDVVPGDDPETVHDLRVALRRLRVALRLYGIGDRELRAELSWFGGALGVVRDLDVLTERLAADLPDEDRPAFAEIADILRAQREQAMRSAAADLSGPRYRDLLSALAALRFPSRDPESLPRKPLRAFTRTLNALGERPSADELHRLRIRAKWVRYAAELDGSRPDLVRAARDLQNVLGHHHDTVTAERHLRDLVADPALSLSPQALVLIGRLIERQATQRSRYENAWPAKARALADLAETTR